MGVESFLMSIEITGNEFRKIIMGRKNKDSNMVNIKWLSEYLDRYKTSIFNISVYNDLLKVKALWEIANNNGNKVIFLGNGGSAAMASHCAVDLTKNAGIRAINFNEADLITCLANDYGYN